MCPVQIALEHGHLLRPTTPVLASLRVLVLNFLGLKSFPADLAVALKCLTELGLAYNLFTSIPAEISKMTTMRILDLDSNDDLQLKHSDLDSLAALPNLQTIVLPESLTDKKSVLEMSLQVEVLNTIRERLPYLEVL